MIISCKYCNLSKFKTFDSNFETCACIWILFRGKVNNFWLEWLVRLVAVSTTVIGNCNAPAVLMRTYAKFIIAITIFTVLVILYSNPNTAVNIKTKILSSSHVVAAAVDNETKSKVSIWISVTKIARGHLLTKFRKFFKSLISQRGKCQAVFELNVITDNTSRSTVDSVVYEFSKQYKETLLTVNINLIFINFSANAVCMLICS